MKTIVPFIILLFIAVSTFAQISGVQEELLFKAYHDKNLKVLRQFINIWQSDIKKVHTDIPNDAKRCIDKICQDILMDSSSEFYSRTKNDKYIIYPSSIKYGFVQDLNPDSNILHQILKARSPDLLNSFKRSGWLNNDMLIDNFYDTPHEDTLFDSTTTFFPIIQSNILLWNDNYEHIFSHFFECSQIEQDEKIDFLSKLINVPISKKWFHSYQCLYNMSFRILIDKQKEWALLYIDRCTSRQEYLLQKSNDKWRRIRLLRTIVYD